MIKDEEQVLLEMQFWKSQCLKYKQMLQDLQDLGFPYIISDSNILTQKRVQQLISDINNIHQSQTYYGENKFDRLEIIRAPLIQLISANNSHENDMRTQTHDSDYTGSQVLSWNKEDIGKQVYVGKSKQVTDKQQSNLRSFFSKSYKNKDKDLQQKQISPFNDTHEIVNQIAPRYSPQLEWCSQRQNNFEQVIQGVHQQDCLVIKQEPQDKRAIQQAKIQRRKYLYIHDSVKELKGFVLKQSSLLITGRTPLVKGSMKFYIIDQSIIDYDKDSEEELEEYLAVGCDSAISSSSEETEQSLLDDQGFVVPDQLINVGLLQEYNLRMNHNQLQSQQIRTGEYHPFYFLFEKCMTPELIQHFQKYSIINLTSDEYPLLSNKQVKFDAPGENPQYFESDENIIELLLYVHGQRRSKLKVIREFISLHPQCPYNTAKSKLELMCNSGQYSPIMIKKHYQNFYDIKEKAKTILDLIQANQVESQDEDIDKQNIQTSTHTQESDNILDSGTNEQLFIYSNNQITSTYPTKIPSGKQSKQKSRRKKSFKSNQHKKNFQI